MKIKRAVYIETDIDGNNLEEFFLNSKQAQEYAGSQLTKTISDVLGSDYAIPAKHIILTKMDISRIFRTAVNRRFPLHSGDGRSMTASQIPSTHLSRKLRLN